MAIVCVSTMSPSAWAGTAFGIYDARTLAMGGVSTASANNDNAQFYNAALLAFNEEIEEKTQDGRFLFPLLVPQFSESAITLEAISRDDSANATSIAIDTFNATPDAVTAQSVVNTSASLDSYLADIEGENLFADVYVGFAVSEPGKLKGAGFFFGTRLLAGGQSSVSVEDRELLAAYQEGLTFIASDGAQGTSRPELFDASGSLIDPRDDFSSTVNAVGVAITEAGVAMSRQISLFGEPVAAGFSIKVQRIKTFEDVERVVDGRIDDEQNSQLDNNFNFDIGVVKELGERWRMALAVKDFIPYNYDTSLDTAIRLRPRARFGMAYATDRLRFGADVDLNENEPLGNEGATQEVAIGAEWAFDFPVSLRGGFRSDVRGNRDNIFSFGIGTVWNRLAVDLAYAAGDDTRSGAVQFGIVF